MAAWTVWTEHEGVYCRTPILRFHSQTNKLTGCFHPVLQTQHLKQTKHQKEVEDIVVNIKDNRNIVQSDEKQIEEG